MTARPLDRPSPEVPSHSRDHFDDRPEVLVIGAGFGGLGTALTLAERGVRVTVCEALRYPGGCASTFERDGARYEAGATLFSGFGDGQLFRRWIDRHRLPVEIEWLDPVVRFRSSDVSIDVPRRRAGLLEQFAKQPGAPVGSLCRFFDLQRRVSDVLWDLLDSPELLPVFDWRTLPRHVLRLPRYAPLLRLIGRPLASVLRSFELHEWKPLRSYLDALCQITVQCGVAEAEAPFALGTMDYYFRGTGHVRGRRPDPRTRLRHPTGGSPRRARRAKGSGGRVRSWPTRCRASSPGSWARGATSDPRWKRSTGASAEVGEPACSTCSSMPQTYPRRRRTISS